MAHHQRIVGVVEVHSAAFAIAEKFTIGADASLCPRAVAEFLKLVVPHVPKIVFVNVALTENRPDAGTHRNVAVAHNRSHRHARLATIKIVADIVFVTSQKTFATVTYVFALGATFYDKIHQLPSFPER